MTTIKHCPKNPNCQLWDMLCDGSPCLVDKEIESSNSINSSRSKRTWHLTGFKSGELIDLAVKLKKTGSKFYKKLAKKTSNEQIKSLMLYLAAEEKQHQVKIRELAKNIVSLDVQEQYQDEYFEYVGSTIESHMFNGDEKIEKLVENARFGLDIIKLAIDFEKDSILFFNGFRNLVVEDKRSMINDMIGEEQLHLIKLTKLRKDVMVQNNKYVIKPEIYLKTVNI